MRQFKRRGVMLGFVLLAASQAFAQEDLGARVKKADEAARANAATPEGREWLQQNSSLVDRLMIVVLNRCLPDPPGDIPTMFTVYLRLSRSGRVGEIVTELDAALGECMTTIARNIPFPEAPREDYWIRLNMAAPL
jgi:hypothetical protein